MSYDNKLETYIKDDDVEVHIEFEYLPSFDRLNCFHWSVELNNETVHPDNIHTRTKKRIEKEIQEWLDNEFIMSGQSYIDDYNDNSDELYDNYRESGC